VSRRWRLDVAYRGTGLHGFADQPGLDTVAGRLADALTRTCRLTERPRLVCAGRTDAGVHALAQVIHVDLPDPLPIRRGAPLDAAGLCRSLNRQLNPAISVRAAQAVAADFDARYDATARRYRYLLEVGPTPDPLLSDVAWQVEGSLDVAAMRAAALTLLGTHDFRSFCRRAPGSSPLEPICRRVLDARIVELDRPSGEWPGSALYGVELEANAFCHHMVRSVVGQLVEVGRGHQSQADFYERLLLADRHGAADPAPAKGLCLIAVRYGEASSADPTGPR